MLDVKFYDTIDDALLKFAVVISQRIFTIQSVLLRFRKVCYTPEFRFRGVFYIKCDKAAITFSWLTPLRGITKIVSSPAMVASISLGAWESMSEAIPMA